MEWLSTYLKRYETITDRVKQLHKSHESKPPLRWYTPHGIPHYEAVEQNIRQLIPPKKVKDLTELERFFLLISAWVHDIGMIKGLMSEDRSITDDDREKEIRDTHHLRSEKYIVENFNRLAIKEEEATAFALLSKFHRRRCDISKCPILYPIPGIKNENMLRLRLLAAYLRLADALHVDKTRVSASQYAITLAYNIPNNSKLHWLRSKFVQHIQVDIENKKLVVHFNGPSKIEPWYRNRLVYLSDIQRDIVEDLTSELNTVKDVLLSYDFSHFLFVDSFIHHVQYDNQTLRDISGLDYYKIMDNPSSSALCSLVLRSIQGVINSNEKEDAINRAIELIVDDIDRNVLESRKCHTGLENLILDIKKKYIGSGINKESIQKDIENKIQTLEEKRNDIRTVSHRYFLRQFNGTSPNMKDRIDANEKINILLYGYSELTMKSLCGLRDVIIDNLKQKPGQPNNFHHKLERLSAECFNIFVCEGQPKNHTDWGGKIVYHDGIRYAQALLDHGFQNIFLIPDAIAGTLLLPLEDTCSFPDFVMVGANGFDDKLFRHSAGHTMISAITRLSNERAKTITPIFILSLFRDKYDKNSSGNPNQGSSSSTNNNWWFKGSFTKESVRNNVFISQDSDVRNLIHSINQEASENDEKPKIVFYNPREDNIPFSLADVVITEKAFFEREICKDKFGGKLIAECEKDNQIDET